MDEAMDRLDEFPETAKAEGLSNNVCGILLRRDLCVVMKQGAAVVEVRLTPAQALDFALNLVATARDFLQEHESLAKKAGESAWAN